MADVFTHCFRCHYDLRGVADDQPCPECGLLAGRSRRATDSLRDARPKWLRSLSIGVWLILLAILGSVILSFWSEVVINSLFTDWNGIRIDLKAKLGIDDNTLFTFISFGGLIFGAVMLSLGMLLVTRPEGYEPSDQQDRGRRFLLRMFAAAPLILVAINLSFSIGLSLSIYRRRSMADWQMVLLAVAAAVLFPLPLLGFAQFRSLAKRAGSAHLAEHCSIVGIGTAVAIVVAFGEALVCFRSDWFGIDDLWFSRSSGWMILMLLVGVAAVLFWLWSLYLMLRFAISFGRASDESRRAWQAADRAQQT